MDLFYIKAHKNVYKKRTDGYRVYIRIIMKELNQYGYNILADMGDNNSDISTKNKTSNIRVMCFNIILMIINKMYINYT